MIAAMVLPTMMIATTANTFIGSVQSTLGWNNMPTETKNSTAKASRKGSDSAAARWLSADSRIIMPAKNAPSANETSNSLAAPNATPTAAATTLSVNSSCEPVRATIHRIFGKTRRPTTSIKRMKAATLASVMPTESQMPVNPASAVAEGLVSGDNTPASAGNNTSTSTMTRSSTTNQPTAIWPLIDLSSPLASSARNSTTVLATERHKIG